MQACAAFLLAMPALLVAGSAGKQCVIYNDPAELFAVSDAVSVAQVIAAEETGETGEHVTSNRGTLRVERVWKGRVRREMRVGSDVPFRVGEKYLVFAGGRPLSMNILCRWAELVRDAETRLKWLSGKSSRSVR